MAHAAMCLNYVYRHCQCISKLCKNVQERENKKIVHLFACGSLRDSGRACLFEGKKQDNLKV